MSLIPLLAISSAGLYCVSMVAMKSWWAVPGFWTGAIIFAALLAAGAIELLALRSERLGLIYLTILAIEVVIIGVASLYIFNESYSMREMAGLGLVLAGTALAWS